MIKIKLPKKLYMIIDKSHYMQAVLKNNGTLTDNVNDIYYTLLSKKRNDKKYYTFVTEDQIKIWKFLLGIDNIDLIILEFDAKDITDIGEVELKSYFGNNLNSVRLYVDDDVNLDTKSYKVVPIFNYLTTLSENKEYLQKLCEIQMYYIRESVSILINNETINETALYSTVINTVLQFRMLYQNNLHDVRNYILYKHMSRVITVTDGDIYGEHLIDYITFNKKLEDGEYLKGYDNNTIDTIYDFHMLINNLQIDYLIIKKKMFKQYENDIKL